MNLKQFHNDTHASMIIYWIIVLAGLLLLGIAYSLTIPIGNVLIRVFVENGAPVAQMLWIRTMTIWGFAIIGVLLIMIGFMASYVRTYDTGQGYQGWMNR